MARAGGRQRSPNEGSDEEHGFFVRALARGVSIMALFDMEHPEWGLSEICADTGMSKTTVYRMLRTLEAKRVLAYDPVTERYRLGEATIPGAYVALSHVAFVRTVHPLLEELSQATGETIELTVEAGRGVAVVDQVHTQHPFRLDLPTGRLLKGLANSSFRMHLAYKPEAEQRRVVASGQPKLTPHTVTEPDEILGRMMREREQEVCYDLEEQDLGVCAVSAPVFDLDGTVMAVLSVVAPAERFGARERKKTTDALRRTAATMSTRLSARGANEQAADSAS
jgi:DNA-binding IclR family transcriptional regulator